jgi:hypothetical protein
MTCMALNLCHGLYPLEMSCMVIAWVWVMEELGYSFLNTSGKIILYLFIFIFNILYVPSKNQKFKTTPHISQNLKFCTVY